MKAIPIAPILPVLGVALQANAQGGTIQHRVASLGQFVSGYHAESGKFDYTVAMPFWTGEVAAIIVHKVANSTGLNKYIRKATMGYLAL